MAQAGFLQVLLRSRVVTSGLQRDQPLRLVRRHAEIQDKALTGEAVDLVFQVLDPSEKFGTLRGGNASGLMSQIRTDVTVDEDDLAAVQRGFQFELGFETITGIKESRKVRVDRFQR